MPPYLLISLEVRSYYQIEPTLNGVDSRDNLPKKIKDGEHIINLDEYANFSTHWIALYCKNYEIVYFDSFVVEHVTKEFENLMGIKT